MQPEIDASIYHLNGLRLPAVAEFFWLVDSLDELEKACAWARQHAQPVTILGAGSNVVARGRVRGLVIQIAILGIRVISDNGSVARLRVCAGENWHDLVGWTLGLNLNGLENLALIPGTVGAAPVQNIGAYGVEVSQTIRAVHIYDWQTDSYRELTAEACLFRYRDSIFKTSKASSWIIVAVEFSLHRRDDVVLTYPELRAAIGEPNPSSKTVYHHVVALRKKKLPDPHEIPNVGSFFKNPIVLAEHAETLARRWPALPQYDAEDGHVKLSAAWMIDYLGWRGKESKGVAVFAGHALVITNTGGATAGALLVLSAQICASVESTFGVQLDWEPRLIGEVGYGASEDGA